LAEWVGGGEFVGEEDVVETVGAAAIDEEGVVACGVGC